MMRARKEILADGTLLNRAAISSAHGNKKA
jgi:hypothetical protein